MDSYADDSGPIASPQQDVFNPRLVGVRADHFNELNDPQLRSFATRALLAEGGVGSLANNFEQLSNYANARGMGIKDALTSGFYGPVKHGAIQSDLTQPQADAADAAIDSVFSKGRNKLGYRIDQGMVGDPNYNTEQNAQYRPAKIDGNFFADHPSVGQGWAQKQLAADLAYTNGGGTIADRQYEAGNPIAAINKAAGVRTPTGPGALSMASTDDDQEEQRPALATAPGVLFGGDTTNNSANAIAQGLTGLGASLASIANPQQGYVLNQQLAGLRKDAEGKYRMSLGKNGEVYRIDPNSGKVEISRSPYAEQANSIPQLIDPNLTGDKAYDALLPADRQIVDSWHEGTGVMPTGYALKNPRVQAQIAAARQVYPDLDFSNFKGRNAMATDLANAAPNRAGGQVAAAGASLEHVGNLVDKYIKLHNGSGGGYGATAWAQNSIKNAGADIERKALLDAIDTDSGLASGEITKVITGGPGGVHERAERAQLLGNHTYAPEEAAAVAEAQASDMKAKYQQTIDKVRSTMGQSYIDRHPEIEKNFNANYDALRDKISQLRTLNKSATDKSAPPMKSFFGF
jgi:hypothetical protein